MDFIIFIHFLESFLQCHTSFTEHQHYFNFTPCGNMSQKEKVVRLLIILKITPKIDYLLYVSTYIHDC